MHDTEVTLEDLKPAKDRFCEIIMNSSGIRQKGESQNGCFKKAKLAKISENKQVLPPDTHTYVCVSRSKKCLFFGNFGVLCFLETPVLRFALLPYYRRIVILLSLNGFCTKL